MTRFRLLLLLLVLAISVPFAAADSILNLTINNIGITGSVGTVDLHQVSAGVVQVTLTANSGFSFKLSGGDIMFNCPGCGLTAGDISGLTFTNFFLKSPAPLGKFGYDIQNIKSGFATSITFDISAEGLTVANFGNFGVHFACTSAVPNCGRNGNTGFAATAVPEPGTLSLLGTGILGLAGFFRRRLFILGA